MYIQISDLCACCERAFPYEQLAESQSHKRFMWLEASKKWNKERGRRNNFSLYIGIHTRIQTTTTTCIVPTSDNQNTSYLCVFFTFLFVINFLCQIPRFHSKKSINTKLFSLCWWVSVCLLYTNKSQTRFVEEKVVGSVRVRWKCCCEDTLVLIWWRRCWWTKSRWWTQ